jgi:hypothetical protein
LFRGTRGDEAKDGERDGEIFHRQSLRLETGIAHNDRRLRPWLAPRAVRGGDRDHSDLMVQLDFTSNAGTSRAAIIPQISQ